MPADGSSSVSILVDLDACYAPTSIQATLSLDQITQIIMFEDDSSATLPMSHISSSAYCAPLLFTWERWGNPYMKEYQSDLRSRKTQSLMAEHFHLLGHSIVDLWVPVLSQQIFIN